MTHTPGPWKVSPVLPGYYEWVRNSDGHLVADCASILPSEECEANAALIAAAPEMLGALEDLVHDIEVYEFEGDFEDDDDFKTTVDKARAAIAKARGEQ